jgi:hypothetical protein
MFNHEKIHNDKVKKLDTCTMYVLSQVQVVLTDVNDNCPAFSSNEYQVTIFETIGVGTDILQLFSTDRDIGENAIAYYSKISGSGTDYDGNYFVSLKLLSIIMIQLLLGHVLADPVLYACQGGNRVFLKKISVALHVYICI